MRFLVVDDHKLFAEGLQIVIEAAFEGASCDLAFSAEAGLQALSSGIPYDLLLVDLTLPQFDGVWFIQAAIQQGVRAPLAVLSSSEDVRKIHAALEAGAAGFIHKSLGTAEVRSAIETMLGGLKFIPPDLDRQLRALTIDADDRAPQSGITRRQLEVLDLLNKGFSNRQIAQSLFVSEDTVKFHVRALFRALNVANRLECTIRARERGLL